MLQLKTEHFCLDKLIPEALPLPEAPPAVRLVHLYKLLCGGTFDRSSPSNALPLTVCLRQETVKTGIEQCEGSFVADAPAECAVWPTSAVQVGPSAEVRCDLKTQQTAISWSLQRTASRRRLTAPK